MVACTYTCDCCATRGGVVRHDAPQPATHVVRMLNKHRNKHLHDFGLQVSGCLFMCAECMAEEEWGDYEGIAFFGDVEPLINGQVPTGKVPCTNPPRPHVY
jgi:hypothetical protein